MILEIMENCNSPVLLNIFSILKKMFNLIIIIGPILLIVSMMYTFTKLVADPEDKKCIKRIKNSIIALILIFIVPVIVNVTMNILGEKFDLASCWNGKSSDINSSYINTDDKEKKPISTSKDKYDNSSNNNETSEESTSSGSFIKYDLSNDQLKQITALCLHEQGTAKGAAAEASLMANRFELHGSNYGKGAKGLVNYVKNSGWFAHSKTYMYDYNIITKSALKAVKSVLVNGKRTLPGYIDEHDCFSDISSLSTGGSVSNRSNYKKHKTVVKNTYGSSYIFYSFPDTNSDPFGYTSKSNRKKIGDDCYSFNDL